MTKRQNSRRTSRRQRRIERRKKEILDAAAHIFAEKGYANTATLEIAEAADIAEGTLYNYFGGKREILLAIVQQTQIAVEAIFQDAEQLRSREDMIALVNKGYEILMSSLPFTRTLLTEAWMDDVILQTFVMERLDVLGHLVQAFIDERINAGLCRPIDSTLATRMILGMFVAPILPVLRGVAPLPTPQERYTLAEAAIDLLVNGIRIRQDEETEW